MILHMLGIPHTRTRDQASHCAYTGKVQRFGPMMTAQGFRVIHYGVGVPQDKLNGWWDAVEVLTEQEQEDLLGYSPTDPESPEFVGRHSDVGSPLYRAFNDSLRRIFVHTKPGPEDIVCAPFGHAHEYGTLDVQPLVMETGIGYPSPLSWNPYRIYESSAWMHWILGKERRNPWISEWVVPNYFDLREWPLRTQDLRTGYVLYFGRITEVKGMNLVWQLARHLPETQFVLCGQGDPAPWLQSAPNIAYHPPVWGADRARMMHKARVVLLPTQYPEPFGGVAVEAMLTGTPVITSDFGAFRETNPCHICRPHTLGGWLEALEYTKTKDSAALRQHAEAYSMESVGPQYARIFEQIPAMRRKGWHARRGDN